MQHGSRRCGQQAAWIAWIGCEHEHVAKSDICEQHIAMVETTTGWQCSLCWKATGEVVMARYIRKEPVDAWSEQAG